MTRSGLIIIVICIILTWTILGLLPHYWFSADVLAKVGDGFGAANALFSALALAGVIFAVKLQSKELELQREELTSTREELARQADAQQLSQKALSEQVQMMTRSARINALSIIIQGIDAEFSTPSVFQSRKIELAKQRQKAMSELQATLKALGSESSSE